MKNVFFTLLAFIIFSNKVLSQDNIVLNSGEQIKSKILEVNQTDIKYKKFANQNGPVYIIPKANVSYVIYENGYKDIINTAGNNQNPGKPVKAINNPPQQFNNSQKNTQSKPVISEQASVGVGSGLDYGGIGAHISYYPQKNLGLFLGLGDAIAGFGYNAGLKLKFLADRNYTVSPYIVGMYGYYAAVDVTNATQLNKLFYGPTIGFGLDFRFNRESNGYWSVALLIPIRNTDPQNYINNLVNNDGATSVASLSPVSFSIGYNFIFSYHK